MPRTRRRRMLLTFGGVAGVAIVLWVGGRELRERARPRADITVWGAVRSRSPASDRPDVTLLKAVAADHGGRDRELVEAMAHQNQLHDGEFFALMWLVPQIADDKSLVTHVACKQMLEERRPNRVLPLIGLVVRLGVKDDVVRTALGTLANSPDPDVSAVAREGLSFLEFPSEK